MTPGRPKSKQRTVRMRVRGSGRVPTGVDSDRPLFKATTKRAEKRKHPMKPVELERRRQKFRERAPKRG